MATTLQQILTTIREVRAVPPEQVNYGISDKLIPPYVAVTEYEHKNTYDTAGATLRDSTFKVLVVDRALENAEAIATALDTVLDTSTTVTKQCMGTFQEGYKVGQLDAPYYQFGVEISYSMQEDTRK